VSEALSGRAAIVTGAGGGIGRAIALQLAAEGARVVVNDIAAAADGRSAAEDVCDEIRAAGGEGVASVDDVTSFDAAARIVGAALEHFGRLDVLVNNAGIAWQGKPWDLDAETFERVTATHIKGGFNCLRHAVLPMKQSGFGRVVNIVSRSGIIGLPDTLAYGVGKGGLFGMTNAASRDLAPFGITVNAVNPASTLTPMVEAAVARLEQGGESDRARAASLRRQLQRPAQVAVLVAALCTPAAAGINGQVFLVEGNRVGLFQPLTVTQQVERDEDWTVADLGEALCSFEPHDLFDAYA
jgi:NAD(P)-dependent dehydrogenase (short-subunit alcohol dehydrogenase family)